MEAAAASLRKDTRGIAPFTKVLVANRGEIALRVIRACRELGIATVAVYSDADATAGHVRAADEAVRIGPPPPTESYLRIDAVVDAAIRSGAEAVHPGYGFLAERAEFARAVVAAGLRFVGPSADAIEGLGDKLRARRLARSVGVPVVPGTLEAAPVADRDALARLEATATEIGFPLLVKAAAGGGGRGMRRVRALEDLADALLAGSAEAASAFGDGSVYLEREISPARHIEVQLLGDAHGTIVALGERDCSLQRRHQKVVEEAPAPGLTPAERAELHALAVRLGEAAGLENAATAEFLFDEERRFWFLEVSSLLFVYMLFSFFFSGHMFPIDMLDKVPGPWATIVRAIPLQYLAYFPAAIFLGKIEGEQLAWGLALQAAWVVAFIIISRVTFHLGVKRYSGYGG